MKRYLIPLLTALAVVTGAARAENLPDTVEAKGVTTFATLHAEGAQIFQCKKAEDGKLLWTFREPIAALMRDGVTLGRHYAGPFWELNDGGRVQGKVVGKAPGATPSDAPWLKLEVIARQGAGLLGDATIIQRLHTKGGVLEGACAQEGGLRAIPYSADYVFLKP